jgi:hypothetical protein
MYCWLIWFCIHSSKIFWSFLGHYLHKSLLVTIQLQNLLLLLHGSFQTTATIEQFTPNAIQRTPPLIIFFAVHFFSTPCTPIIGSRLFQLPFQFQFKSTNRFQHLHYLIPRHVFGLANIPAPTSMVASINSFFFLFFHAAFLLLVLQFWTSALICRIPQTVFNTIHFWLYGTFSYDKQSKFSCTSSNFKFKARL